jgi:hypothetical protein
MTALIVTALCNFHSYGGDLDSRLIEHALAYYSAVKKNVPIRSAKRERVQYFQEVTLKNDDEAINCTAWFDDIHKSSTQFFEEKDRINTHLTIECQKKSVMHEIIIYNLAKVANDIVPMADIKKIPTNIKPKKQALKKGYHVIARYSISASSSECGDAPEPGLYAFAEACILFSLPGYKIIQFNNHCAEQGNGVLGCSLKSTFTHEEL